MTTGTKILGREPTLWIGAIAAILAIIATFGFRWLDARQAAAIVAVLYALLGVANALLVRPISPVAFTWALSALVTLAAAYGLEISQETVGVIATGIVPILLLLARGQVSPVETAVTRESQPAEIARETGGIGLRPS